MDLNLANPKDNHRKLELKLKLKREIKGMSESKEEIRTSLPSFYSLSKTLRSAKGERARLRE